jgi:ankyrin repeat protein
MAGARTGQPEVLKLLLARGADPNATERRFGETALMWAAGHDNADAIRCSLRAVQNPMFIQRLLICRRSTSTSLSL